MSEEKPEEEKPDVPKKLQFKDMDREDQLELGKDIGKCLKEHGLGTVPVTIYREEVCSLSEKEVESSRVLKVVKQLPIADKQKADDFKEAVKKIIEKYEKDDDVKDQVLTGTMEGVQIQVNAILGPGDQYQVIKDVTTLDDAETPVNIEHTPGEVLLIDFWATWCPPCQAPMAHNEKMLEEKGETWKDKVKIIGLSIDQSADIVKKHVEAKDWMRPTHYWRAKSDCSDVYSVKGVPHVMLVDTNGKIVFKGHPANRPDLATDLSDLLAGKTITGEGCAVIKEEKDESAEPEEAAVPKRQKGHRDFSNDDMRKYNNQMDTFKRETGRDMQSSCKEYVQAGDMPRAFCVLVMTACLMPATQKWSGQYQNYRVLVGPQEKIDSVIKCISNEFDKRGSQDFEVVVRIQSV